MCTGVDLIIVSVETIHKTRSAYHQPGGRAYSYGMSHTYLQGEKIFTKAQSQGICIEHRNPIIRHMLTNGILIEKKCFIGAPRHWQALFKSAEASGPTS